MKLLDSFVYQALERKRWCKIIVSPLHKKKYRPGLFVISFLFSNVMWKFRKKEIKKNR